MQVINAIPKPKSNLNLNLSNQKDTFQFFFLHHYSQWVQAKSPDIIKLAT